MHITLPPPNWESVRPIYKKLSDEFHVLTSAYGVELDDDTKLMLDHLILCIDGIDQYIDDLPTQRQRDTITRAILSYLSDHYDDWDQSLGPKALSDQISTIKLIVQHQRIVSRFHLAAEQIFTFTEEKRHTTSQETLIKLVMKEGRATAELPLSIMQLEKVSPFGQFFTRLCTLMGIADLIIDARSDYRAGYIAIRPNYRLMTRLILRLIRDGLKAFWSFPRKLSLIIYCIKFGWLLLMSKD